MSDFGMMDARRQELNARYPGGWDVAHTRADADKLYAGGIVAVRPVGEEWPDNQDDDEGCPGHCDDDATLTSGVGIGEPVYCDGSCQG